MTTAAASVPLTLKAAFCQAFVQSGRYQHALRHQVYQIPSAAVCHRSGEGISEGLQFVWKGANLARCNIERTGVSLVTCVAGDILVAATQHAVTLNMWRQM